VESTTYPDLPVVPIREIALIHILNYIFLKKLKMQKVFSDG